MVLRGPRRRASRGDEGRPPGALRGGSAGGPLAAQGEMGDQDPRGIKPHLERLTLGVTRLLETSPGVTEVMFVEKEPAERHAIISWEQKNACVLPEDLRNFYLMTDGFRMTWSVKFDDNPVSLGCMMINSISKLTRLGVPPAYALPSAPTLADLEDTDEEEGTS